jgi:ribonuclease P protein component
MALPKKLKAPTHSIRQVFNTNGLKSWRFNHFWRIYRIPNEQQTIARFATIIAKKHIPLSTQRNKIERIIHAWILIHQHEFSEQYDYVFVWSFSLKKQVEKIIVESLETHQYFNLVNVIHLKEIQEELAVQPVVVQPMNQKVFKRADVLSINHQLLKQLLQKSFLWNTFSFRDLKGI